MIEEEGNNATQTFKAAWSDLVIICMHNEGVEDCSITVTLSDEVYNFIEKFKEENQ